MNNIQFISPKWDSTRSFSGPELQRGQPLDLRERFEFYRLGCLILTFMAGGVMPDVVHAESDVDFFENRIRPILVAKCDGCHSNAKGKTSGGLALDTREGWQKGSDNGAVIVPGKPDESLLIKAVRYQDKDLQMPPPQKGGKLTDLEIAALTEWVTRGAPDPRITAARIGGMSRDEARRWWSFQPLRAPAVPTVGDVAWPRTDLDRFIAKQREQHGVKPVVDADKRTLIRRATFDLTGLPPTPDEIQAFLQDDSSDAYKKLVDRLLASPDYGVRWGRHWLDVARYADTAGDGSDYPVPQAGLYRDWVVNAINNDQPFDQFIREQVAGDILARTGSPDDYARLVTATGFLAIGKRYGYAPNPDYQYLDFADVIDSVSRSLLGLSVGCARCHDHKYDPLTAADYYALYGIFQSTTWAFPGGEEQKRPSQFPPLVPPEEAAKRDQTKATELARLDGEIARLKSEKATLDGKSFAGGIDLAFEGQPVSKPPAAPWLAAGPVAVIAEAQSPFAHVHPAGTRGARLSCKASGDGVRYVFQQGLRATPGQQMHFTIDFRTVSAGDPPGSYRFYLGRGVVQSVAIDCSVSATEFAVRNGANWEVVRKVEPGTWYTLRLTLDPAKKIFSGIVGTAADLTMIPEKGLGPNWDGVADTFICDGNGHIPGPALTRDLDNIGLQTNPFNAPGGEPVPTPALPADWKERVAKLDADLAATTKLRDTEAARIAYPVAYGVSEGKPVNARLQKRGEPDQLGDEVPRRFLEILGGDPVPAEAPGSGRLELANWLARRTNPLTARVFVNRVWQWHFGQGLVATPSDFGTRGELPSHPELLDWLASEFIASGWSMKSLHRLIMQSRTYQLSSDDDPVNLKTDPANRWYWRYTRRALDAESIRDAMLAISGRLDRSTPEVHPFPPVGTWAFTIHNPFHAVYDNNRRSIYLMVQRNRRHPFLALFDAADPNQSVAERQPTTTPTQTLFLMNSPFVHQQSDGFASRLLAMPGDDAARIQWAFEACHGKQPAAEEISDALAFVSGYTKKLADQGVPADKQAIGAWAALGRVLLTSNGLLYVD
ncbi:MAG: hypothetical protein JWN70_1263 [Planctomycetaceae bacterium]|nr:hypothetical protein [Planctomycetaceae bacterium]